MKKINLYSILPINLIIILLSSNVLYADEIIADKKKYTFNYDQEIPTLIRYGSTVSGVISKTGYIGFIQHEDSNSRSSIDIGYNLTYCELYPATISRGYALVGFGYIPFIYEALTPVFAIVNEERHITMISPIIGYSVSIQLLSWLKTGFSINTGPVYVNRIKPWTTDNYNDDYRYEDYMKAYNAIGNVSGKWGGRLNPKVKLFFLNSDDNTVNFGLGFGYTQYVFSNNHFNSYDIGLDFSRAF